MKLRQGRNIVPKGRNSSRRLLTAKAKEMGGLPKLSKSKNWFRPIEIGRLPNPTKDTIERSGFTLYFGSHNMMDEGNFL